MSIGKVIEEQAAMFRDLGKRLAEPVGPEEVRRLTEEIAAGEVARIEARIARLEAARADILTRYDEALAAEKEALARLAASRPSVPRSPSDTPPRRERSPSGGSRARKPAEPR